jgi:hypothetical protein
MSYKNSYLKKLLSLSLIGAFFLSGCATLFKGSTSELDIDSKPPAIVYINGVERGETPLKLDLDSEEEYDIEFRKDGYKTKSFHLGNDIGVKWIVLDVLGGFVPIIVDAATGDWHELDQDRVYFNLEKQQ